MVPCRSVSPAGSRVAPVELPAFRISVGPDKVIHILVALIAVLGFAAFIVVSAHATFDGAGWATFVDGSSFCKGKLTQ